MNRTELTPEMWKYEMRQVEIMLAKRVAKHGTGALISPHEIYGVVLEEVREMETAIQQNLDGELYAELVDIAVAAVWGMASIRNAMKFHEKANNE